MSLLYFKNALFGIFAKVGINDLRRAKESDIPIDLQHSVSSTSIVSTPLPPLFHGSPQLLMQREISKTFKDAVEGHNSFFVADLSQIYKQHLRWVKHLPQVRPFYAVKCNPDPYILRLLAGLGAGFDCASVWEIKEVLAALGNKSDSGEQIIFANPCKFSADVRYAAQNDVMMSTFDNLDELEKTACFHPRSQLLLRLLTDDSGSRFPLGQKYGASLSIVPILLKRARELNLDVIGVAFHVGSSCYNADVFRDSIWRSRQVFDMAAEAGYTLRLLDIGGGFDDSPVDPSDIGFEETAGVIRKAILDYFPEGSRTAGFEVIAEPGRFHVFPSFTYATCIIARRAPLSVVDVSQEDGKENETPYMYYLSDGTYGGLANIHADKRPAQPYVITMGGSFDVSYDKSDLELCSLWGPTCDSVDVVSPQTFLPRTLRIGDWIGFPDMGAYTTCLATQFNGCEVGRVIHATGVGEDGEEVYRILT